MLHVNVVALTGLPVTPETSSHWLLMLLLFPPWILSEMLECRFNFAHLNYNYKHGALLAGKFKLSPGIQWINSVLRVTATLCRCQSKLGPPMHWTVKSELQRLYNLHCTVYTVHCTVYNCTVQCSFVQCALAVQIVQCSVQLWSSSVQWSELASAKLNPKLRTDLWPTACFRLVSDDALA